MVGMKETFIEVDEVQQMLGVGKTKAYSIIKKYNGELAAKGFLIIRGIARSINKTSHIRAQALIWLFFLLVFKDTCEIGERLNVCQSVERSIT